MELKDFFIYLAIMAGSTYLIRAIPFAAVKNKIENKYISSFLYYIPYTVLAAMTFPAVLYATDYIVSGMAGFIVAVFCAYRGFSLTKVAVIACVSVYLAELIISHIM